MLGAAVAVGLEHADDSVCFQFSGCGNGSSYFGWKVSVIVYECGPFVRASEFKSAGDPSKSQQRVGTGFGSDSQLVSCDESSHCIFGVMATWHGQLYGGPVFALAMNEASTAFPFKLEVGIGMLAVGDGSFKSGRKLCRIAIFQFFHNAVVQYLWPRDCFKKGCEAFAEVVVCGVSCVMVGIQARYYCDIGRQRKIRPVALVGFHYEPFAGVPASSAADFVQISAHQKTRAQTCLHENERKH